MTPRLQILDLLYEAIALAKQAILFASGFVYLVQQGLGGKIGATFGAFILKLAEELDAFSILTDHFLVLPQFICLFFSGADDVHHAQVLELRQKVLIIKMVEHKAVFLHLLDHCNSSRRSLRIFCAALERFSSSSMKRLIRRMASSKAGICTFS
ncbi:hypothetical protein DSECCO2_525540 [anaerobic digester metagenome]